MIRLISAVVIAVPLAGCSLQPDPPPQVQLSAYGGMGDRMGQCLQYASEVHLPQADLGRRRFRKLMNNVRANAKAPAETSQRETGTMTRIRQSLLAILAIAVGALPVGGPGRGAEPVKELRLDYAYYNPVSLVLKEKGWLEEELKADGIDVVWVQSLGSNKALEFLNAGSLDFGSTAGAAALSGQDQRQSDQLGVRLFHARNGRRWSPRANSPIQTVADLKGKRVAVTRGTDPHIFLIRALAENGLSDKDVRLVLLQHQDGRLALENGDVDAWAGLDPLMAQAEIESGARLFYRNPANNTWGILNVRSEFAADHPELVERVLRAYEKARLHALANPDELKQTIAAAARLPEPVVARQLERTDLTHSAIGAAQEETIVAAGLALQQAGVIAADVDVRAAADALVDPSFAAKLAAK